VTVLETRVANGSDDGNIFSEFGHLLDDILSDLFWLGHFGNRRIKPVDELHGSLIYEFVVFFDLFWVQLKERALLPQGQLGGLNLDDRPEFFEGLDIELELVNIRVLSGRVIQIELHLIDLTHLLGQMSQLLVHHFDGLVILIFESLGVVFSEFVQFSLDLVQILLENLLFVVKTVYDFFSVTSQGFLFSLNVLVDLQDLIVSLLDRFNMFFENLKSWIVIQEAQPLNKIVVLVNKFLALE
jgi:hypothetical protein